MDEYLENDEGEFLRYRGQDLAQVMLLFLPGAMLSCMSFAQSFRSIHASARSNPKDMEEKSCPSRIGQTHSSQSSINKLLLQFGNLSLESLNLLPAIQRSAIIQPQTLHKPILCLFQRSISLIKLLARLEFLAQLGDFF